jgi:thiol:disulfide interchange protein
MKKILILGAFLFLAPFLKAQKGSPAPAVIWTFSAVQSPKGYLIKAHADIAPGWGLFSMSMKDEEPNSRIRLDSATLRVARTGNPFESGNLQKENNRLLGGLAIRYFEYRADFFLPVSPDRSASSLTGSVTFMAIRGDSVTSPEEVPFRFGVTAAGQLVVKKAGLQESAADSQALKRSSIDLSSPVNGCGGTGGEDSSKKSLWGIFVLGFLGGLVGLIMPCTFPMIPLTVSFFTKKSGTRQKGIFNALMYGFFIFLIYVLLSLPFYFLDAGSSDILNNISTNAWLNIFFAIIFIAFALSFFGLYEITLPSRFTNSVDSKSDVGSLGGIFFMALTLAIVSFSCTGPILGSLLVGALNQNGGALQLTVAMGGFGLALGLPFALFALFPNWLSTLPRSGGWMNTVKIVFGFLELALAVKFISNADLVKHWGILKREVFFGIWILIGALLVLYLLGILKFSYDPPPKKLGRLRLGFALLFLAFIIYLSPGLTNTRYANRALVSGFPPPLTYSIYGKGADRADRVEAAVINDYDLALKMAREQHKPVLIDFTGWACVNCRKMEENVWTDSRVRDLIEKNFILVSLYVDDRKLLDAKDQFLFRGPDGTTKKIRTVGDKFITLQSENFKNASQPLYAIVSPDEKLLNLPVGYTPAVADYSSWLSCGIEAFHKIP